MAKDWTLTEAFAHFGAERKNQRWIWSARTADGNALVVALWADRFDMKQNPPVYDGTESESDASWVANRPGNREHLQDLAWGQDHCAGEFRVVMVRAKDPAARPREIADCFPKDGWVMRLIELDRALGQFRAMLVKS